MKKINKYIQYFILISLAIVLIASIFEPLFIWILFLALPIGITQYLGSLIDVIIHGKKSIYRYHLLISTTVLAIITINTDIGIFRLDGLFEGIATFIGFTGSAGLAIYFWHLTFRKEEEVREEQEHSVYDL
mgnify:CR=1 FL=1